MDNELLNRPHLKENPFIVPQGYFEEVISQWAVRDAQEVPEEVAPETTRARTVWAFIRPQLQFAAGFALLFGLGVGMFQLLSRATNKGDHVFALTEDEQMTLLYGRSLRYLTGLEEDHIYLLEPEEPLMQTMEVDDMVEYLGTHGYTATNLLYWDSYE